MCSCATAIRMLKCDVGTRLEMTLLRLNFLCQPRQASQPSLDDNLYDVMEISGDEVAGAVLKEFGKWPQKRKPLVRSDGAREWVPLSGIVAQGQNH
jgi:hypothetical protein